MKKLLYAGLISLFLSIGALGEAGAAPYTFDFNSLDFDASSSQIAAYMTNIFSSPVTINAVGEPETNGFFEFGGLLGNISGTDKYIESENNFGHPNVISITFSRPITSVSFDWASWNDNFYADADGANFFSHPGTGLLNVSSGHVSTYTFSSPVTTLSFHDGSIGEVGIDNLVVNTVPEPSTFFLIGFGLTGLAVYRRTFKKA